MAVGDIAWIAADWGTSRLRLWAMSRQGEVLGSRASNDGMGRLAQAEFEPALLRLADDWLTPPAAAPMTVIACGMVGARQGWAEAAYRAVPCPPLGPGFTRPQVATPGLAVHLVPGLSQAKPADVMRGEEVQIAGWLATNPGWDGVICLPGSHAKWAEVSAGEVVGFRTFMTGELYAAIAGQTVLRHSVTGGEAGAGGAQESSEEIDKAALAEAVGETLSRPESLAARLFAIRAEGLLAGLAPQVARGRLSGLLIGAEMAASRPFWLGRDVVVIGEGRLAGLYAGALEQQGVPSRSPDAGAMVLAGLRAAKAILEGRT